jgi:hypothetical protein
MEWIAVCRVNVSNPLCIILELGKIRIRAYLARKITFLVYQMDEPMDENPQALTTSSSSYAVVHGCRISWQLGLQLWLTLFRKMSNGFYKRKIYIVKQENYGIIVSKIHMLYR